MSDLCFDTSLPTPILLESCEEATKMVLDVSSDISYVLRLDGRTFGRLTTNLKKPFDDVFRGAMRATMVELAKEVQGTVGGYTNSDEITIIFRSIPTKDETHRAIYFGGVVQKIVSVLSGYASKVFGNYITDYLNSDIALTISELYRNALYKISREGTFDCRIFIMPTELEAEVYEARYKSNYRNAVASISMQYYAAKQLHKKNVKERIEMLNLKGVSLSDFPIAYVNGYTLLKREKELTEDSSAIGKSATAKKRYEWYTEPYVPISKSSRLFQKIQIPTNA